MKICAATLLAVLVLYLCWLDESLAAKRKKHNDKANALHRHQHRQHKYAPNGISKKVYWQKMNDLNKQLAKQIRKNGKDGVSKMWKKKWRKAKKNLNKQYKAAFGKGPSKKERRKYSNKAYNVHRDMGRKRGKRSKKHVTKAGSNGKQNGRKVTEENERKVSKENIVSRGTGGENEHGGGQTASSHVSHSRVQENRPFTPPANATHQETPEQTRNGSSETAGEGKNSDVPAQDADGEGADNGEHNPYTNIVEELSKLRYRLEEVRGFSDDFNFTNTTWEPDMFAENWVSDIKKDNMNQEDMKKRANELVQMIKESRSQMSSQAEEKKVVNDMKDIGKMGQDIKKMIEAIPKQ